MAGFLSLLRAFLWLRWRSLVNPVVASRRRGVEAQLSAWGEVAVWVVLGVFGFFGSLALAVGAGFVPALLASGTTARLGALAGLRVLLALVTLALSFFAVYQAYRGGMASSPRLRLLPVSLRRLHLLELGSAAVDPWILVSLPSFLVLAVAVLVVRPSGVPLVLLATTLLLGVWVLLAATVSLGVQLLLRDRRRAGWVVLMAFVAWMSLVSIPASMDHDSDDDEVAEEAAERYPEETTGVAEGGGEGAETESESAASDDDGGTAETGEASSAPAGGATGPEGTVEDAQEDPDVRKPRRQAVEEDFFPWFLQVLPSEAYALVLAGAVEPEPAAAPVEDPDTNADDSSARSGAVPPGDAVPPGGTAVGSAGASSSESAPEGRLFALGRVLLRGASSSPSAGEAAVGLAALVLQVALLYPLSLLVWRRLLSRPGSASGRRGAVASPLPGLPVPGLEPAVAAVAWAQVRGVWRTVQGKLALAGPAVAGVILTLAFDLGEVGAGTETGEMAGAALVALAMVGITLLSQQAVQLNQFAVDGTGLTLQFLSPVDDRTLLRGKALAGVILSLAAVLPALVVAASLVEGASPWIWLAAVFATLGVQALLAPVAAWASIYLPKAVDLDKLGKAGQAHQGAAFLGMLAAGTLLGPAAAVGAVALLVWQSPPLLLVMEALVAILSWLLAIPLLTAAERTLARRREALFLALGEGE